MKLTHRLGSAVRAAALAALLVAPPLAAQDAKARADSGVFFVTLGKDTIMVERFKAAGNTYQGEVINRTNPRTTRGKYTATLNPDGTISRIELIRPAVPGLPGQTTTAEYRGDSAFVTIKRNDSTITRNAAFPKGTVASLGLGQAFGLQQLLVQQALAAKKDSVTLNVLPMGQSQPAQVIAKRIGTDSIVLSVPQFAERLKIDRNGRILGGGAPNTTFQIAIARVPTANFDALATAWADKPLGTLSPRDTARATVGGANLVIDYGRPMKRGRKVFGDVVKWNEVWRTGANTATHFTTDKDLVIAGTAVPAGTYTLWTLPSESGWKLILNKQTKQWGTEYKQDQDLARIDIKTEKTSQPVEQFTITIEPSAQGGVIKLAWDDTQALVPFTVKQSAP